MTYRVCDLLGIRVPVLLAPMANGPGTPELAAAVTRAGGLGTLGLSGTSAEAAAAAVHEARRLAGGGPIGVNVQVAPPTSPTCDEHDLLEFLRPFRRELGLPEEPPPPPPADPPVALLEAGLAAGARVATTFGDPAPVIAVVAAASVPLLCMVTSVVEARRTVEVGAAALIAQGTESGGHRGVFVPPGEQLRPTLDLVRQITEALGRTSPVIASGGIVDRAGVAGAFAAGAEAVSCGTIFLQADEAGVVDAHRAAVRGAAAPDATVVTDAVTGRPARWIRNRLVDALVEAGIGHAGWPRQGALIADIRRAAAEQGRTDILPILAGTAAGRTGRRRPAGRIVAELSVATSTR